MNVKILSYTKNPLETMAYAASRCYMSEPKSDLVKNCWDSGHCSIAEHSYFTFEITNVSRSLLAQLTRHRIASYSVTSQRYVSMSDADFIYPEVQSDDQFDIYCDAFNISQEAYVKLQQLGAKNEDARAVLPNACPTNIVMTINLRSLANFMNERLCVRAQNEIRSLAKEMKKCVLSLDEWTEDFKDYLDKRILVPKCEKNAIHFCSERKSCKKYKTAKEINNILSDAQKISWTGQVFDENYFICPECKTAYHLPFTGLDYCFNCGAKIGKEE